MGNKSLLSKLQMLIMAACITAVTGLFIISPAGLAAAQEWQGPTCCPGEIYPQDFQLTKPYMHDEEISELQIALKQLGFYKGKINGVFDPATETAVKEFQQTYKLTCDGVVGMETREKLAHLFEKSITHTSTPVSPKGIVEIVIDIDKKTLTVNENNKRFKEYYVAVGKEKTPTPIGEWKISRKARNWGTGFGTRWMELSVPWGIYGIHGTNKPWSIGTEASGGCIRMFNWDVEELYRWVKVGTTVRIVGELYPPLYEDRKKVHKGHDGAVVMLIQQGLRAEGYLNQPPDGVFGQATEDALKKLQKDRKFEVTGQVETDIWPVLGL